jgi:hypothetical protein
MSTLSEIRDNVQNNWPDDYHSTYLDDDKTDEYINDTQRWICRGTLIVPNIAPIMNYNFSWMKREVYADTVDSQQRYALPDGTGTIWDFKAEISCDLIDASNNRVPLTKRIKYDIENDPRFNDTDETGTPDTYCIDHDAIWLYPIPDHSRNESSAWTFNLEYYGYILDLSGDSDTNTLTNEYPKILEYGATELGYEHGQDFEQAGYWAMKKQKMFLEMIRADQQHILSGLEEGLVPRAGCGMGEDSPGQSGYYYNDTHYD